MHLYAFDCKLICGARSVKGPPTNLHLDCDSAVTPFGQSHAAPAGCTIPNCQIHAIHGPSKCFTSGDSKCGSTSLECSPSPACWCRPPVRADEPASGRVSGARTS